MKQYETESTINSFFEFSLSDTEQDELRSQSFEDVIRGCTKQFDASFDKAFGGVKEPSLRR